MNDFSLTRVFVLPVGNTLPTTGTTATLAPNQFGAFLPSFAPATAANIGAADWFFLAQGRPNEDLNLRSIKSDRIFANKVISKYKITASAVQRNKIIQVSDFKASCGEQVTLAIRAFSQDIDVSYYNGQTRTYVVSTPCCECGESPCEDLDAAGTDALIDAFAAKINADKLFNGVVNAARVGSGLTATLWIQGKPVVRQKDQANNPRNFTYEYDAVNFFVYATRGAYTTQDYVVESNCDTFATVTTLQDITYERGTSDQVRKVELEHVAYTVPAFKTQYTDNNFNGLLHLNVVDGVLYDEYVIKFQNPETLNNWGNFIQQDSTVRIFVQSGTSQATGLETLLVAKVGAFENKSGATVTTTTSTTTTTAP